ncbi:MAG: hypothetical protein ACRDJF_12290 [Actinomycetota bacterium]
MRLNGFALCLLGLAVMTTSCTSKAAPTAASLEDRLLTQLRETAPHLVDRVKKVSVDPEDERRLVIRSDLPRAATSLTQSQELCETAQAAAILPKVMITAEDGSSLWLCEEKSSGAGSDLQELLKEEEKRRLEEQRRAEEERRRLEEERRRAKEKLRQEPPEPRCHPSYEGVCLPPDASDVDCPGGSGNGPVYAPHGNFRVVGPDAYDLDRDGDGIACE